MEDQKHHSRSQYINRAQTVSPATISIVSYILSKNQEIQWLGVPIYLVSQLLKVDYGGTGESYRRHSMDDSSERICG